MTYSSEWWNAVRGQLPELFDGEAVTTGYRSYDAAQIPDSVRRQAWSKVLNLPELDQVRGKRVLAKFVENIPIGFARRFQLVVFAEGTDSQPLAAIADPEHWEQLDVVRRHLEITCDVCLAPEEEILAAINVAYKERLDQSQGIVTTMAASDEASSRELMDGMLQYEDLLDSSVHPPVIKLVNAVLLEAIKAGASDIHIQPLETELVVRQRIDGVLFDALKVPVEFRDEVISRMKVLGKMNIAEKRLPQDGRASVRVGDVAVDLRIASLPTSHGERVVVRFLDKGARLYTLNELGMADVMLTRFLELIKLEHGLLLVTGPTGSGKSTTLYAALQEINSETLNVLTLEDPIEYQLDGISQTQINTKKGLTFAKGLRNVLR
ncbi:MAG: Flp pilus assembly complex ATPase component TadA, partial [Planctomycetales bacterium]|nr:Flp pilus assembly complex ATPase component TadA [Planctomycetales bacterium]